MESKQIKILQSFLGRAVRLLSDGGMKNQIHLEKYESVTETELGMRSLEIALQLVEDLRSVLIDLETKTGDSTSANEIIYLIKDIYRWALEATAGDLYERLLREIVFFHIEYGGIGESAEWTEKFFAEILETDLEMRATVFSVGVAFLLKNRFFQAEKVFKRGLNFSEDFPEYYLGLGFVYLRKGEKIKALQMRDILNRSEEPEFAAIINLLLIKETCSTEDILNSLSRLALPE